MAPSDEDKKFQELLDQLPEEARSSYMPDNNGNLVFKNRAYRRRKPPADNWFTKNTHQIKKKRDKIRAKSKHNRRLAQTRESSTQDN